MAKGNEAMTQLASKYITPENKQEIWGEKDN